MADFSILLICKFRQYKVVNIAYFVYYYKTRMDARQLNLKREKMIVSYWRWRSQYFWIHGKNRHHHFQFFLQHRIFGVLKNQITWKKRKMPWIYCTTLRSPHCSVWMMMLHKCTFPLFANWNIVRKLLDKYKYYSFSFDVRIRPK